MSNRNDVLVELRDITKLYRTDEVETRALDAVSVTVARGEFVAIAGPSGCGKTTLLSILGLLDTPTEGQYRLAGRNVADLPIVDQAQVRNREIGFVFQAFNLVGDRNVMENVELPLTYRPIAASQRRALASAALERVGMSHRARHFPAQLSGGQQQRVAVARAIAGGPSLLLADEPTGNLDSANGEAVMELLGALHAEGATICMVTHDPRYAEHANRTIHLFDGRLAGDQGGEAQRELAASGFRLM